MSEYKEPLVTFVVLDFLKEEETHLCLKSIQSRVKFDHKVIYYHNGPDAEYPYKFLRHGLCDTFIQTTKNEGLGIGTRDLCKMVSTPYFVMMQNDQYVGRDFDEVELSYLIDKLDQPFVGSISLAGDVCGGGKYSERMHIMKSDFYQQMEKEIPLGHYGAGPYHAGPWREEQIQKYYAENGFVHVVDWPRMVVDNGKSAIRQNPDGSIWQHQPDRKGLKLLTGQVKEKYVYPKFTDAEWEYVLKNQSWPEWQIPEMEKAHSFHVWN